jgi:hypothetical protein
LPIQPTLTSPTPMAAAALLLVLFICGLPAYWRL